MPVPSAPDIMDAVHTVKQTLKAAHANPQLLRDLCPGDPVVRIDQI